jgi:hypothetical protein
MEIAGRFVGVLGIMYFNPRRGGFVFTPLMEVEQKVMKFLE